MLPYLSELKDLACTISDGAEYAHLQGNDAEAIERIFDVLHIARTLQSDDYFVSYAVSVGIDALACHTIQLIAPDLVVEDKQIRPLIDRLLEDHQNSAVFRRAWLNERILTIHWYAKNAKRNWFLSPLADRDAVRILPRFDIFLPAADCTNFVDAQNMLDKYHRDHPPQAMRFVIGFPTQTIVPRYSRWYYSDVDLTPWFDRNFRVIAERRITAVSLACQLYRAKNGHFPESLEQLVPEFLPAIPKDPFFADGRPIGYTIKSLPAPLKGPRPFLYFDPGGGDFVPKAEPIYDWYALPVSGPQVRQYRDISRFVPPASPKAVNNNPYQSNAPGKNSEEDDDLQKPDATQVHGAQDAAAKP
jgi:hypothetical protein